MPDVATAVTLTRCGAPVAHLVLEDGSAFGLTNTPEQGTVGGLGRAFTQLPRQGLKPLVRIDQQKVRTLTFTHHLADAIGEGRWTDEAVRNLADLADRGFKMRLVGMSPLETAGWWFIVDLTITITRRHDDQSIREADLSWSLLEAFDQRPEVGKVPPPPPPPAPPAAPANAAPDAGSGRTHTVVKGDTLWAIAGKYLGQNTRWPEIAKLNADVLAKSPGIKNDPHWIYPGQVFKIPAK